jgi:hypothetical protein
MRYLKMVIGASVIGILLALFLAIGPARADDSSDADKMVHKALKERTHTFCRAVLPAWFKQGRGEGSPAFRTMVADCYLGHARLAVLGVSDSLSLKDVGLSELPSALLAKEVGMALDVYGPLAGRTLKDYAKSD